MTTQFQTWLNLLYTAKKGPIQLLPAVRGQVYKHILSVAGDLTTATLTGDVRANPDSNAALATFTIGTPDFADGYTSWEFSLTDTATGALPVDGDGDGVEYFPYDFLLTLSGASPERLFGGLLPLSGHITEPA